MQPSHVQPLTIRLAEIDTPERGQPFGRWAKEQLADMVAGKEIAITLVSEFFNSIGRLPTIPKISEGMVAGPSSTATTTAPQFHLPGHPSSR